MNKLQEHYEKETGKQWWTNPVCHGEIRFASWEYQVWLEEKASQLEPRGKPEIAEQVIQILDDGLIIFRTSEHDIMAGHINPIDRKRDFEMAKNIIKEINSKFSR